MNSARNLHDAFAEYERQADLVSASRASADDPLGDPSRPPGPHRRVPALAVAVAAVVLIALGVAVLVGRDTSARRDGAPVGAQPTTGPRASSAAVPSSLLPRSPSSVPSTQSTPAAPTSHVPRNRAEMVRSLRRVLRDTATFTVTESHGNYVIGVLTATASGRQGGFDIQAYQGQPGDEAICEDADTSHCVVRKPAPGGSLSTGHESTSGGGVLYLVNYVRPDGGSYLMHLSSNQDPKGGGTNFGPRPPLTLKAVVAILESDRW